MEFDSPDVEKDFPGLYASESSKRDSDYSDDEKTSKKDLLGKKKEKRESKKDKGYVAFEGESSGNEMDETRSPGKSKKSKSAFKFPGKDKKEKQHKSKEKDGKEKKEEKEKICKKDSKKETKDTEKLKDKVKKKKERGILKIKDRKKKSVDQGIAGEEEKPIFGVPLSIAVERSKSHDGIEIPVVVRECIDYIEEHGLACEGIYKISGLKSKLRHLKAQYNQREKVYLYEHEPHIVASLLKQFLRDLPESILTQQLMPKFEEAAALKDEKKCQEALMKLIEQLPKCNRLLLSWIFVHMLHVMKLEKRNKMNLQNVSIVLSPTLQISHHVLQALFAHSHVLFKGVEIKKYVPPIELDSSRLSLELPDSPTAIADELSKQENFLNILHAELNTGLRDKEKEEQLWEVQRVVTQLKRKLRFLRQVQDASKPAVDEVKHAPKPAVGVVQVNQELKESQKSSENMTQLPESSKCNVSSPSRSEAKTTDEVISPCMPEKEIVPKNLEFESKMICDVVKRESPLSAVKDVPLPDSLKAEESCLSSKVDDKSPVSEKDLEIKSENVSNKNSSVVVCDIVPPVSQPKKTKVLQSFEDEAVLHNLVREEIMLRIQHDELVLLGDELRRKINSEKLEIDRLHSEIIEYQQLYKFKRYSFGSTENSSSDSNESSSTDVEEEDDLCKILESLMKENEILEVKNIDLSKVIQHEREVCLNIKVQMKMLHQIR